MIKYKKGVPMTNLPLTDPITLAKWFTKAELKVLLTEPSPSGPVRDKEAPK